MQKGRLYTVKAAHCILACWHPVIPYLTTEIPAAQLAALRSAEKVPIVYTNVALKNWQSFVRLQTAGIYAPGSYFTEVSLDHRVSIGNYHCTNKPDEPIVLTMNHYPCSPGLPARSQHRAGRAALYTTSIRDLREEHQGAAGAQHWRWRLRSSARHRRDHGESLAPRLRLPIQLPLGSVLAGRRPPALRRGRKPFGRIAIANADADAYAYTDCAINQAHRQSTISSWQQPN